MSSVVIDTNVLEHCHNKHDRYHHSSKQYVDAFLERGVKLVVDEGYSSDPSQNQSQIGKEYSERLPHGTYGFAFLLKVFDSRQFELVPNNNITRMKRRFRQMVRNPVDIIFLSVAASSEDRILISNDYRDMQETKRAQWRKDKLVVVLNSEEAIADI